MPPAVDPWLPSWAASSLSSISAVVLSEKASIWPTSSETGRDGTDVTALSGWVTTDSGTPLAFSTVQNPTGRRIQAGDLALPGQLLQALLSYPQAPPAEQLSPLPPNPT